MPTFNPNIPKYGPELSVGAPRSHEFLGRGQKRQDTRASQKPPMVPSPNENIPYEESLNRHYRNVALSLQAKSMLGAAEVSEMVPAKGFEFCCYSC